MYPHGLDEACRHPRILRSSREKRSRQTELEYDNVYQLLVAVVLSAQATDAGVNRATTPLFEKIKTPAQMVALGERS